MLAHATVGMLYWTFSSRARLSKLFLAAGCEAAMITIFTIGNSTCQRDSHLSNENCVRSSAITFVSCGWLPVVGCWCISTILLSSMGSWFVVVAISPVISYVGIVEPFLHATYVNVFLRTIRMISRV